jgi:DNA-binding LytR/AlgR family response regulator
MQNYNCLIVEDEPLAAEVLEDYIKQVPFLDLKGICTDALFALDFLQKENIDLIFLDIHLPKLKGLDFLKVLKNPPKVILTTAYHEYALQGYELNVLDYLLKPIEFSRFLQAVNKLEQSKTSKNFENEAITGTNKERIFHFFNVDKKKIKIYEDEILYIESLKEYVRIFTASQNLITKFQLGQIEDILDKTHFIRTHRSFLVAKDKIEAYTATHVEIKGKEIPIGRNYKELVMSLLEK